MQILLGTLLDHRIFLSSPSASRHGAKRWISKTNNDIIVPSKAYWRGL